MIYKLITASTELPITLAEAKAQLNIESSFTDDDTLITSCIYAAGKYMENLLQHPLMEQVWELQLADFKTRVLVQKKPVSIDSIKYDDIDNTDQTVTSTNYQVITDTVPALIVFYSSYAFPTVRDERLDAVRIRFTSGYADATVVPEDIKLQIKILVTQYYEHRDMNMVKPHVQEQLQRFIMANSAWL